MNEKTGFKDKNNVDICDKDICYVDVIIGGYADSEGVLEKVIGYIMKPINGNHYRFYSNKYISYIDLKDIKTSNIEALDKDTHRDELTKSGYEYSHLL